MAFIYKRAESDVYQCAFYVTDTSSGERQKVRITTGSSNNKDAQRFADEQENIDQSMINSVYIRGSPDFLDKIRVGLTYHSVLLGTKPLAVKPE